jgi:hypothetical protein
VTRDQRLLFSIVVMLFAILLTLIGGAAVGLITAAVAFVIALTAPASRT